MKIEGILPSSFSFLFEVYRFILVSLPRLFSQLWNDILVSRSALRAAFIEKKQKTLIRKGATKPTGDRKWLIFSLSRKKIDENKRAFHRAPP